LKAASSLNGLYDLDDRGVLIRIAPSDGSKQVVVPKSLRSKFLYLEHYPMAVAHPAAHRMFRTMRRSFYWPHMAEDVYETVRQCDACARNRISERLYTNFLQLFPAKGPLESVALDILGPLPRTKHGNRFLLVIADRYTKVTRTVPLRTITALSVARAFVDQWVYVYGPPMSLLTENGPQFTAKFFPTMSTSSIAHPKTRATGKAGGLSSAAPMGTTVPSSPIDTRMDDATRPIPSSGEPMATAVDPEGSSAPNLFDHLMEDVANVRDAISVSRMREDSLFDRVSTLEAMVATLRDSTHRTSVVVATHRDSNIVMNEEDVNEEEEDFIDDVKSFGNRRKRTQKGRIPNRHKARSARDKDSSSESSTSSVDYDASLGPNGGERVRKGPRVAGLVKLTTRRPEFRPLVSYRSYRVAIRTQTIDDRVTSKVNSYLKMMRHHVTGQFIGEHAIRIFIF
jgi:Integrase zinc binding domain